MAEHIFVPHTFTKMGVFYFRRRVPRDLTHHYTSQHISYSLRTRSPSVAAARAVRAAQRLDEYWYHLRINANDLPGKHMLRMGQVSMSGAAVGSEALGRTDTLMLSEAVAEYIRLKGRDRPQTFHRAAERACGYVIDVCGDKDITAYTRADANTFRDDLISRNLTGSSITRVFGTIRSVLNFAASEAGIEMPNAFAKVYYDRSAGVANRAPIPVQAIRNLLAECHRADDDLRWLVALISDTGMRLAEAAGLQRADIKLEGDIPHVVIQEHPWRRLKTNGSAREVPLVGEALWAARRIIEAEQHGTFAFPRYNKTKVTNANAASAALNKWLKPYVPTKCTMHSFRHSMRDRLRAAECPADIVDQIGGWQTEGVGHSYGRGYPLQILAKWMTEMLEAASSA